MEYNEMMESGEVVERLAILQERKIAVTKSINELQADKGRDIDDSNRLKNFISEAGQINTKIKLFSALYKRCIDQILIERLKLMVGEDKFTKAYSEAQKVYAERNASKV